MISDPAAAPGIPAVGSSSFVISSSPSPSDDDSAGSLGLSSSDGALCPSERTAAAAAPPPRRRGLSKLRRRLSQTFRLSFHGSLSELAAAAPALTIDESEEADGESEVVFEVGKCSKEPARRGQQSRRYAIYLP